MSPRLFSWICLAILLAGPFARAADPILSAEQCRVFLQSGEGVLLDARGAKHFAKQHIPGALNLPVNDFDRGYAAVKASLRTDRRIVVYCTSTNCPDAGRLRAKLEKLGHTRVEVFKGGLAAWWKAGLPLARAPKE